MAQTKASRGRAKASGAGSSRSTNARSKGSQANRRSNSGRSAASSSRPRSKARSSANGKGPVATAKKTVGKGARSTASTVSTAADKARVPLMAGGAAVAGLVGGAALAGRNRRGRKVLGMPVPRGLSMPRPRNGGSTAKALGSAAKEVAKAGYRFGELTTEVRKTREQIANK
jgi:hypothetical protein